jgi:3-hydroxymyristoyl/3-hydroxydecanoyl-(acyl carrier protein) dehydratase
MANSTSQLKPKISFVRSKVFTSCDTVFTGHYPNFPIYPASFLIDYCCKEVCNYFTAEQFNELELFVSRSSFFYAIKPNDSINFEFYIQTNGDISVVANNEGNKVLSILFKKYRGDFQFPDVFVDVTSTDLAPAIDYLPQRYPLLVIDLIDNSDRKDVGFAIKYISYGDYSYSGLNTTNYEKHEIAYPYGAVIEGIEQSAALLLSHNWQVVNVNNVIVIGGLNGIVFFGHAYPGDVIHFYSSIIYQSDANVILTGVAMVDDRIILAIDKIFVLIR